MEWDGEYMSSIFSYASRRSWATMHARRDFLRNE
jgi:hypothetical protein